MNPEQTASATQGSNLSAAVLADVTLTGLDSAGSVKLAGYLQYPNTLVEELGGRYSTDLPQFGTAQLELDEAVARSALEVVRVKLMGSTLGDSGDLRIALGRSISTLCKALDNADRALMDRLERSDKLPDFAKGLERVIVSRIGDEAKQVYENFSKE